MKLSLSVRVAESFTNKRISTVPFLELAQAASSAGYAALCLRASVISVDDDAAKRSEIRQTLQACHLAVSMVTGDFMVPENSVEGPNCLRHITPYLDLCQDMGCDLIRVCIKYADDIVWARRAADEARERNIRLAHQCHTASRFETVDQSLETLEQIGRPNFGLIYEPANLALCNQPYGQAILERFAPYLFNVYLQNHVPDPAGTLIMTTWSQGNVPSTLYRFVDTAGIDMPTVILALKNIGYTGFVTLHHTQLDKLTPLEAAVESAGYLQNLMDT